MHRRLSHVDCSLSVVSPIQKRGTAPAVLV
jgi:hypothetical protein